MDRGPSTSEPLVNLMSTRGTSDLGDLMTCLMMGEIRMTLFQLDNSESVALSSSGTLTLAREVRHFKASAAPIKTKANMAMIDVSTI